MLLFRRSKWVLRPFVIYGKTYIIMSRDGLRLRAERRVSKTGFQRRFFSHPTLRLEIKELSVETSLKGILLIHAPTGDSELLFRGAPMSLLYAISILAENLR